MSDKKLISVCIPSYNRPEYISDLMESIVLQDYNDFEIVVSEDNSPKKNEIETIINNYSKNYPNIPIHFFSNDETLGYDGNFRKLIEISKGKYCVYMGDDDLLCPGALSRIGTVIKANKDVGVIIRSWARVDRETKEVIEHFKYFDGDRFFSPGLNTIVSIFRRSVSIAGYTVNRELAKKFSTSKFDGTLLYQLYLSGMILRNSPAYYISDLIAKMRKDSNQKPTHFFGTSKAEKDRFQPGKLEMSHSLQFIDGMIDIAKYISEFHGSKILYSDILDDLGCYSYPLLSVQSERSFYDFTRYYFALLKKGLWRSIYTHLYYFALIILGRNFCEKSIIFTKSKFKRTPLLGGVYSGKKVL